MGRPGRDALRAALTGTFCVAALIGVGGALRGADWAAGREILRPAAGPLFAAAFFANLAGLALAAASWRVLVSGEGVHLPPVASGRMFAVNLLGKYIPGRVWGLFAQLRLGGDTGIPAARIGTAYLVSLVVSAICGSTVGLLAAPCLLGAAVGWLAVPALLVTGWLIWPDVVNRLLGAAAKVLRRPAADGMVGRGAIRAAIGLSLLSWLVSGLHLWAIAILVGAPVGRSLPLCVGGFALAMVVGSLAMVVPDGWGVREVVITIPLATVLPLPAAVAAAVGSRLVVLASELCGCAAMFLAMRRETRSCSNQSASGLSSPAAPGCSAATLCDTSQHTATRSSESTCARVASQLGLAADTSSATSGTRD